MKVQVVAELESSIQVKMISLWDLWRQLSQVHIARAFSKSKFPNPHGNATSFMTLSNQEHQEPKQVLFELSVSTCIWQILLSRQASELLRKMILPQEFVFTRASHTMLLLGRTFRTPQWFRCLRSGHASNGSKAWSYGCMSRIWKSGAMWANIWWSYLCSTAKHA